ncbi:HNH endonuclease [Cryobacterium sp. Hh11]|uniref:HNH endonuclease signature motif containing protein n=1 Tax=Cryobacterium sp. Hh11 TaxID=2555868 RepID=UPI00106BCB82|nr:HNH endonuclease signature motif containing protein [Cryobacterium sp. Hh11]TFD48034.1 HNH endonuclease [Cryobacterium sp. Hh11]
MTLTAPPAAAGSMPECEGSRVAVIAQAGALLASVLDGVRFGQLHDSEAVAELAALEGLGRKVDGARVRATTDIGARAETDLGNGSLAYKNGCRNRVEFITQLAGISGREAKRRLKLGETTVERTPLGLPVPARYPVIADGLISGDLGVESAEIIATTLTALQGRVGQDDLDRVERALVASATGAITPETAGLPGAGIRFAPDMLRAQAMEWQGRLDPDGTAPGDDAVEAKSTLTFGLLRNGLYPLRVDVTPELRGIMDTLFDTFLSARSRTPIFVPTELLESRNKPELDGIDSIDGVESIPGSAAFGTGPFSAAPFTGDTRFDGGCIIPGCTIPARWTEVHHVLPWHEGGLTNIDNGTLPGPSHHHVIHRG